MKNTLPTAIGPYSAALKTSAKELLFVSGQIPVDPATGKLVQSDIKEATRQVLTNIKAILTDAGTDFNHVVKVEIFLTNIDDFQDVNAIYAEFFTKTPYPARQTVQVSGLPKNAIIEISCIAEIPSKEV